MSQELPVDPFWGCVVPKHPPKKDIDYKRTREKMLGIRDSRDFEAKWVQDQHDKEEAHEFKKMVESAKFKRMYRKYLKDKKRGAKLKNLLNKL